jgi:DNA topoisomerase I
MSKSLIIVESPTKARTIEKFLGKGFTILASYGHVRDLPNNAAEIPAELKKEKWARLGINVDADFEPLYIIPDEKKKRVKELKAAVKGAQHIYLATDEDREGESISWHLVEVLQPKIPVKRLVFHEITKSAIERALETPRDIDENLVRAQETRRLIDRLFGYTVSPLLWKKMAPRLSAGRVQSVALRLLVERELERVRFTSADFWDLKGLFLPDNGDISFETELTHVDGKRVASGKDFAPETGKLLPQADVVHLNEATAHALKESLLTAAASVKAVDRKPFTTKPYPPFTTSTLQQEAGRKLGFAARRTMQVAQTLYENGYITYMRTDSTSLSQEALEGARNLIARDFGREFLPQEPRIYKTKVKNAQEAHEAIRPAGSEFAPPAVVKQKLGQEAFRLYELIWQRALACQMKDATGTRVGVQVTCGNAQFRASGKTIEFPGFLRAYVEGADDPEAELADKEKILPPLTEGQGLKVITITPLGHTTQAPARYTEGSLIKQLETLGIGRPSTWATIVDVVLQRTYAFKKGTALVPTFLAIAVIKLMERFFPNVINYEFTANLEEDLDSISRGEADYLKYLSEFYLGGRPGLEALVRKGEEIIDPREVCGVPIGTSNDIVIEVRIGRYGPFLTDGETRSSIPGDLPPDELDLEKAKQILEEAKKGPVSLGNHPETGKPVYVKKGRFGPYVQEGDVESGDDKPKMASLLAGMNPEEVTLDTAVKLLSLPLKLGIFPDNNEEIEVFNGRYGPYVKAGSETRSLPQDLSPLNVVFEQAVELLRQPKTRGRRTAAAAKPMKELGKHPLTELPLVIKSGRYGPYVTDGKINASLPSGTDPEGISLEDAVGFINARAEKLGVAVGEDPKKGAKKKTSPKRAAAKKEKATEKKASTKTKKKETSPKKGSAAKKPATKRARSSKKSDSNQSAGVGG